MKPNLEQLCNNIEKLCSGKTVNGNYVYSEILILDPDYTLPDEHAFMLNQIPCQEIDQNNEIHTQPTLLVFYSCLMSLLNMITCKKCGSDLISWQETRYVRNSYQHFFPFIYFKITNFLFDFNMLKFNIYIFQAWVTDRLYWSLQG